MKTKKLISVLFVILLTASLVLSASAESLNADSKTPDEAIAAYEEQTGETIETFRCYFQMPDGVHGPRYEDSVTASWYNEYAQGAGIYWWQGPAACASWPGCRAMVADEQQHIYYADIPKQVEFIIWNNGVDGGMDPTQAIYQSSKLTVDISCTDIEPGVYDTLPEGAENLDGCIVITDPEVTTAVLQPYDKCFLYFYYGNGCYGMYAADSDKFIDVDHNCCNPDHFDTDGNHVGYVPERLRGDYDRDGNITIMDATRAQNIIALLYTDADSSDLKEIDADGDGELTIMDATRIQRVIAELCDWEGNLPIPGDEYEMPLIR